MSQRRYDLDPCHFYTSPGLSWQAMLKMTGASLELMTDIDQILFIEKGIRGGISQISNRYARANNLYVEGCDPSKETSFLAYYVINNLYGLSLSDILPVGLFRFVDLDEIDTFAIHAIPEDRLKGYVLEVDLKYPKNSHDNHNDYPLAPEKSSYPTKSSHPMLKVLKKLDNKSESLPSRAKVEKLLTTSKIKNSMSYTIGPYNSIFNWDINLEKSIAFWNLNRDHL